MMMDIITDDSLVYYGMTDTVASLLAEAEKILTPGVAWRIRGFRVTRGTRYDTKGQTVRFLTEALDQTVDKGEPPYPPKGILFLGKYAAVFCFQVYTHSLISNKLGYSGFSWFLHVELERALNEFLKEQYGDAQKIPFFYPVTELLCLYDVEQKSVQVRIRFDLKKRNRLSVSDLQVV